MRSVLQGMLGKIHYANVLHALFSLRLVALKKKNVVLFLWTKTFNNNNNKKCRVHEYSILIWITLKPGGGSTHNPLTAMGYNTSQQLIGLY